MADIAAKIRASFGIERAVEGVRHVPARPARPQADPGRQETFRADFARLAREAADGKAEGKPLEVRFRDEARAGRKGTPERVRAPKNTRPRIQRDRRYGCCVLFGAACASRGEAAGLVAAKANTDAMNEHPAAIGAAVTDAAHGALEPDGAGRH